MWIFLALGSAIFLGIYDVFKKVSVDKNAVIPVLFLSTLFGSLLFLVPFTLSKLQVIASDGMLYVPSITVWEHVLIGIKTLIVVSGWVLAFVALKHLPITIASPIRSTGPVWTLIGAIIIYAEHLNYGQWTGVAITLLFFYLFSTTGKVEGIHFRYNKFVWFTIVATLLNSCSGLLDKYLMLHINRMAVQTYFTFYQSILLFIVLMANWWPKRKSAGPFQFRWSIPMIGICLAVADFLYFYALTDPSSMISIISTLRRSSVILAFTIGGFLFKEKNLRSKALYLAGILIGVITIVLSK